MVNIQVGQIILLPSTYLIYFCSSVDFMSKFILIRESYNYFPRKLHSGRRNCIYNSKTLLLTRFGNISLTLWPPSLPISILDPRPRSTHIVTWILILKQLKSSLMKRDTHTSGGTVTTHLTIFVRMTNLLHSRRTLYQLNHCVGTKIKRW